MTKPDLVRTHVRAALAGRIPDGVTIDMIAVINQTWGALFSQRPELALRFSQLISSV